MKTKTLKLDEFGKTSYRRVPAIGEKVTFETGIEKDGVVVIPKGTKCEVNGHHHHRGQTSLYVTTSDGKLYTVEFHKLSRSIIMAMRPKTPPTHKIRDARLYNG